MKKNVIKMICLVCFMAAGTMSVNAQDLKSILSGVVSSVAEKVTGQSSLSIEGTWNYVGPSCKFESDNLLAKAGASVASTKVEEQISNVLTKLGFTEGATFVFNSDSTYTQTVKGRTTKGTYTFDADAKTLAMKTSYGKTFNATVSKDVQTQNLNLLFDADKLMSVAQTLTNAVGSKLTSVQTISSLLEQYDGMKIGLEMEKAD